MLVAPPGGHPALLTLRFASGFAISALPRSVGYEPFATAEGKLAYIELRRQKV